MFGNDIPVIQSPSVERIAKELYLAIRNKESIFVYGDYDMDGLCCQMVWQTVLKFAGVQNIQHFRYCTRTHSLDKNILDQLKKSDARVVIICDTGSSYEDGVVELMLENDGRVPIVIDHHIFERNYAKESENGRFLFNSIEESSVVGDKEVSGAYASLLVANFLCAKYLKSAVPYDARVWALASMYSDCVDMSSDIARALYNSVASGKAPGPVELRWMNKFEYMFGRRFFSYIVAPQINACFRAEEFGGLNDLIEARDTLAAQLAVKRIEKCREKTQAIKERVPDWFTVEGDNLLLAVHELNQESDSLHVQNYTGIVAQQIASQKRKAVIAVVHACGRYKGSYRDYYGRPLLDKCKLFMYAAGHPSAFGVEFSSLSETRRYTGVLEKQLEEVGRSKNVVFPAGLVEDSMDVNTLALYNEYMNTRGLVYLSHTPTRMKQLKSTRFTKVYDVGLPMNISSPVPLYSGTSLLLEPCICRKVEMRLCE